ncbi:methyltransferase [Lithospermum erythrorhizon]|uniref:U6 small nuclear RNA (adenine-(43)-N(6))-methyltransferase n=1 Tax=Lithospermum erythrorhizon TaxID=34254 RepID=A0AAV3Q9J2_LITER
MPSKKKRKRGLEKRSINKYSEKPADFDKLGSLYPTFQPYVFYSSDGRPRIDWTDFNATRELTRVLLLHHHALNWWIPDGQLCPTLPNRSNYIHWIEDLLASDIIPVIGTQVHVKGFDIGTGANCIYPLLGASLLGWTFVASDVTDVALECSEKNVKSNPHISELIEIRRVHFEEAKHKSESGNGEKSDFRREMVSGNLDSFHMQSEPASIELESSAKSYHGPPILLGVVKEGERFDFCMCNPPFFETIDEAGLNPKTACGGTPNEMVCPGGEQAFITRIIEDSVQLKQSFRWYTSMVGRKSNLKYLIAKLWGFGVTIVKTTEFVQGRTSRWGLAWSFIPPKRNTVPFNMVEKTSLNFSLEGLERQHSAINVLQSANSFFCSCSASCKLDVNSFHLDIIAASGHCDALLRSEAQNENGLAVWKGELESSNDSEHQESLLRLRISVFQQIPGTLLVKGSLQQRECALSGAFPLLFQKLEDHLKAEFCRKGPK